MAKKYVIGIDEVGRGPLAGPVTVAAVAVPRRAIWIMRQGTRRVPLRDSKRLSANQREAWYNWLHQQSANSKGQIAFTTASVAPAVIDRINITRAANRAATRAATRLMRQGKWKTTRVLLDGGLYLDPSLLVASGYTLVARTVVRGDEKYTAIKLASIVAKVRRDRYMQRKHKEYPQYGFDHHKGYGTKMHYRALRKHGPSPLHRRTFL